jgi:hypothetical protein
MDKLNCFTQHPVENGMTYFQHLKFALMLSRKTMGCAFASLMHAFFPFFFITYTSRTIFKLNEIFKNRND